MVGYKGFLAGGGITAGIGILLMVFGIFYHFIFPGSGHPDQLFFFITGIILLILGGIMIGLGYAKYQKSQKTYKFKRHKY